MPPLSPDGVPLVEGVRANYRKMAALQGTTLEEMEEKMKEEVRTHSCRQTHALSQTNETHTHPTHTCALPQIRNGTFKLKDADVEEANIQRAAQMLYAADLVKNAGRAAYNWTLGLVGGGRYEYKWTESPINLASILKTLAEVHAHQIFVDGMFNGDPHPGNVLLMRDGRLGLIDYGQVKRWTLPQRLAYAELISALADDDREEIYRAFTKELKMQSTRNDPDVMYRLACFWNDRNTVDVTNGLNLQEFQDWAEAEDPQVFVPNWPVMASRVNVLIRGMGNAFGLQMTVADLWAPIARELLAKEGPALGRAVDVDGQ